MAQPKKQKLSSRSKDIFLAATKILAEDKQTRGERFLDLIERQPTDVAESVLLRVTYETRKQLLLDLVNMRDKGEGWFGKRWADCLRPERVDDVYELRDDLRLIWKRPAVHSADKILDNWLAWRPSAEHWRKYRESEIEMPIATNAKRYLGVSCSIEAAKLVPDFCNLRTSLIQAVFEHWPHFKFCANSDCASPYFIAKRKDQTVCDSDACKAEKQRQHALNWWRENRAKKPRAAPQKAS